MSEVYALRYRDPDEGCNIPNWIGIWNDRKIAEDVQKKTKDPTVIVTFSEEEHAADHPGYFQPTKPDYFISEKSERKANDRFMKIMAMPGRKFWRKKPSINQEIDFETMRMKVRFSARIIVVPPSESRIPIDQAGEIFLDTLANDNTPWSKINVGVGVHD